MHQSAINRLAAAGIVVGKPAGRFDPNAPVRRDQMATMLMRAVAAVAGPERQAEVGRGVDDPAGGTRRDQMAAFLTRLLELLGR